MSYVASHALQGAVFQLLQGDAALSAIVGSAVFDEMPPGPVEGTYVSLGEEDVVDRSDQTGLMATHRFQVSIISDVEGFATAKAAAGAVTEALLAGPWNLSQGRVVSMSFQKARARRVRAGQVRRIDLTFRAIVDNE